METLSSTGESVWKPEIFPSFFGFKTENNTLTKNINGEDVFFYKVTDADSLATVVKVQKRAWRWKDRELAPVHILALMEDTGGGVFAAYNKKGKVLGFAAGFGGGMDKITGKPVLISSMLAMNGDDLRSKGIGKELKIVQAHYAYQNGYTMMKWLYDPERGENASLNMRKLGAMAEEFYINKYGTMLSALYGPVPTDRFRAVWRFTEKNTLSKMLNGHNESLSINIDDIPLTSDTYLPNERHVAVQISDNIDNEPEDVRIARRHKLRIILTHYFLKNEYIASRFVSKRDDATQERKNFYILEPLNQVIQRGDISLN